MDFVEGLPRLEGFLVLFVVVDRLSKSTLFIPLKHPFITASMARAFIREQGTVLKRSTAYYPQTDGQTKVVNRSLEIYLRCFTSQRPRRRLNGYLGQNTVTFEVDLYFVERDEPVAWRNSRMRPYRQLTMMGKRNENLSPRYYGLYRVRERVGEVAYKLQLPEGDQKHLVFHVLQLKRALGDGVEVSTLPTGVADSDEELAFAPAAVLDVRGKEGRREVLIT
ncbi:putative mitochondrial protein [Tanacetum coccineum]